MLVLLCDSSRTLDIGIAFVLSCVHYVFPLLLDRSLSVARSLCRSRALTRLSLYLFNELACRVQGLTEV